MYEPLPGQLPNPTAGQRQLSLQARRMIDEVEGAFSGVDEAVDAAVDKSMKRAREQGTSPRVIIGSTPPVPQSGRLPMSQKATDDSVKMLCFGGMTLLLCGGVAILLVASDKANPVVIGVFFGGIAAVVLAFKALVKNLRRLPPREINNHNYGPVIQDNRQDHSTTETHNRWWGRSST